MKCPHGHGQMEMVPGSIRDIGSYRFREEKCTFCGHSESVSVLVGKRSFSGKRRRKSLDDSVLLGPQNRWKS